MGSYGKFVADIAGQVRIGGFPFAGFRVFENQVAKFGFDLFFGLAIEFGDVVEIDAAMLVERDENPSSALCTRVIGGVLPTTSLDMMAALAALPVTSS